MSLTAANAVIMLSIGTLYPIPQQLSGFEVDDVFETEAIDTAEIKMGVDGKLSAGFVFVAVPQTFVLQADSASNQLFDAWYASEKALKDKIFAQCTITLPALGQEWALTNGVLTSYKPLPDAKKILQARRFQITWESASPAISV